MKYAKEYLAAKETVMKNPSTKNFLGISESFRKQVDGISLSGCSRKAAENTIAIATKLDSELTDISNLVFSRENDQSMVSSIVKINLALHFALAKKLVAIGTDGGKDEGMYSKPHLLVLETSMKACQKIINDAGKAFHAHIIGEEDLKSISNGFLKMVADVSKIPAASVINRNGGREFYHEDESFAFDRELYGVQASFANLAGKLNEVV